MKQAARVVLVAATIFAGMAGINTRTAGAMTACWNKHGAHIDTLAQQHKVSQALILSLVYWESGCRENSVRFEPHVYNWPAVVRMAGGNNAERRFLASSYGLAQVLGVTARGMGYKGTPEEFGAASLEYGVRYLAGKLKQYGNENDALAAYNGGHGAILRKQRIGIYGVSVEAYVRGVLALRRVYATPILTAWAREVRRHGGSEKMARTRYWCSANRRPLLGGDGL